MFLRLTNREKSHTGFPRVRGDVPTKTRHPPPSKAFSPRARGCSFLPQGSKDAAEVFPACAGMFPSYLVRTHPPRCFPRVRGDVPMRIGPCDVGDAFSPRTRGCSYRCGFGRFDEPVFPACAGMFPTGTPPGTPATRFPRVRGDVPEWTGVKKGGRRFSPRARGCSPQGGELLTIEPVFPACAGMFRCGA